MNKGIIKTLYIIDSCSFIYESIKSIMGNDGLNIRHLHYADCESLTFYKSCLTDVEEIIISVYRYNQLKIIDTILSCRKKIKLIAIVNGERSQMIKILLSLGVHFIVSLRDPVFIFKQVLGNKNLECYITPRFKTIINNFERNYLVDLQKSLAGGKSNLTKRERATIISLLCGLTTRKLAKKNHCSIKTVSAHKTNALKKLREKSINQFFL